MDKVSGPGRAVFYTSFRHLPVPPCSFNAVLVASSLDTSGARTRLQISRLSILTCACFLGRDDAVCRGTDQGRRRSSAAHLLHMRHNQSGGHIRRRVGSLFELGTQSPPESTEIKTPFIRLKNHVKKYLLLNEQIFFSFPLSSFHTSCTSEIIIKKRTTLRSFVVKSHN